MYCIEGIVVQNNISAIRLAKAKEEAAERLKTLKAFDKDAHHALKLQLAKSRASDVIERLQAILAGLLTQSGLKQLTHNKHIAGSNPARPTLNHYSVTTYKLLRIYNLPCYCRCHIDFNQQGLKLKRRQAQELKVLNSKTIIEIGGDLN